MAKAKNATKLSEDLIQLRSASEHIESAVLNLRAARASFGEDEGQRCELKSVSAAVVAAKDSIAKGVENLGSLLPGSAADRAANDIASSLYDTFDLVLLTCAVLKSRRVPHGDGVTICPLAGSLSAINERMEAHALAIKLLARETEASEAQPRQKAAA